LAHCTNAKNIECEAMWLFLKNTHLVHPCTLHPRGKTLENPGTPWGVRYTRLTSTALCILGPEILFYLVGYPYKPAVGFQQIQRFVEEFWKFAAVLNSSQKR